MRACKSVRRVVSGATALMLAVCMVMCMSMCTFASFVISSFAVTAPAFATDADRSYASWSDVSKAIDSQLNQAKVNIKAAIIRELPHDSRQLTIPFMLLRI